MQHPHKPPMFNGINPYSIFALIAVATVVVAMLINFMLWMYGKATGSDVLGCTKIRYESVQAVPEANMILAFDEKGRLCSYLHRESRWIGVPLTPPTEPIVPAPAPVVPPHATTTSTNP